jgi:acetoin utilization deacetylase AcuC-like enzyme
VPERLDSILDAMQAAGLGPIVAPADAGLAPLEAVHERDMLDVLATAHRDADPPASPAFPSFFAPPGQRRAPTSPAGRLGLYCVDMEVPIDAHTWDAALASAHCAYAGAVHLRRGARHVYALCRPPGHHAGPNFCGGYCYLNNAAIAARALGEDGARVAILDIDYHHGNGTQAIFYADPDVGYGSLHIDPNVAYPYFAGYADEVGTGAGRGTNWNRPLPPSTGEARYLSELAELLARLHAFAPRWLVVSAGFDAYEHDPISSFHITTAGFREIGQRIRSLGRPTLVVQEGGYCVPDLGANVVAFLHGLTLNG